MNHLPRYQALMVSAAVAMAAPLAAQDSVPARPLSLEEAIRLALPASENVGIARAELGRAEGEVHRARADLLPQLTGTASYTRTVKSQYSFSGGPTDTTLTTSCARFAANPSLPIDQRVDSLELTVQCLSALNPFSALSNLPFGRKNQYNFGLQFSQTLLSGALVRGRPRAAVAGRRIARLGLTAAEAQATLDVTQAYYDAALADRLLAIGQATLDQADTTLEQTRLGRRLGTVPEFDLLRAQVTRDNQHAAVVRNRNDRDIAHLRLKQLLSLPYEQPLELSTTLDEVPPDTLAVSPGDTATEERGAVRQTAEAVTVQQVLTDVTRAERWPTVTLTSKYAQIAYPSSGLPSSGDFLTDWNIAVNLSIPLWTSGRIGGDVLVQEAALTQARLRHQQARKLAAMDASQVALDLNAALASWAATEGTVEQAQRAYHIAEIRYHEGISTQTELSDARILLEQAQATRAMAARDVAVARTRLHLLRDLPLPGADVSQTLSSAASGQQTLQQQAPAPAASTSNGVGP
jgi:outer membrane protein TolC